MKKKIAWVIGMLVDKISSINSRLRSQYILHRFAHHGDNVQIETGCNITASNMYVGDNVYIGSGATFLSTNARIILGSNIMFGPNVSIVTGNHRVDIIGKYMVDIQEDDKRQSDDEDVVIEEDVWIGMGVIILKGVHIGKGSVIGAGTLITDDIPPYSIVTNERKIRIRPRFSETEILTHEQMINMQVTGGNR